MNSRGRSPATVLFPFSGNAVGGSHISSSLLIGGLDAARYRCLAVTNRDGPLVDFLKNRGVDVRILPWVPEYLATEKRAYRQAGHILATLPRLSRFLADIGARIVHVNDARTSLVWNPAARIAGCGLVHHQRTKFFQSRAAAAAAGIAHRVIAISGYVQSTLPPRAQRRSVVVTNPFETKDTPAAEDRAQLRNRLGIPVDAVVLTLVGTLQTQKRPWVFLEAAAALRRMSPLPFRFVFCGRAGELTEQDILRKAHSLGLRDHVQLIGFTPDVKSVVLASDALLAPAIEEGHGRALVEAMLAGVPVVASRSGGHVEVIDDGETGLLVPLEDPEALATAALHLVADAAFRQQIVTAAGIRARQRYSVAAHVKDIETLYAGLLAAA